MAARAALALLTCVASGMGPIGCSDTEGSDKKAAVEDDAGSTAHAQAGSSSKSSTTTASTNDRSGAGGSDAKMADAGAPAKSTPSTPKDTTKDKPKAEPQKDSTAAVDERAGYKHRTLKNGLEVYFAQDTTTASVSVQVWYKVGSKDDPAHRSGFAHLFEHLMFKATRNLPPETLDRLTEDVGGSNNAFTADDTTAYYEIVPSNHLERILFAEAERMGSLVVDDASFQSERDVVKEELRQRVLAEPYGRLFSLYLPQETFQEHPYRRPGIGSLADLDAAKIDEVLAFHSTFYRPDNAYLIVVGNFEEAELSSWVDKYFGTIARPDRALPHNDVKEPARTAPRETTYYAPNVTLPAVLVNWLLPKYDSQDTAALTVLDAILSMGASSRLYRALVYQQQNAVEIGTQLDQQQQAGSFSAYALMSDGHTAKEGRDALLAEVAKLRDAAVSSTELDEAIHEIVAARLRNRETLLGRGNDLGESLIMTGDPGNADKLLERIRKVTAQDVQRVAQTYLGADTYLVLNYLGDAGKPADAPAEPRSPATDAPISLDSLAPAGPVVMLAPEGERKPLPGPGPERDIKTPAVSEQRLKNGMHVLVVPRKNLPLVSAKLSFNAGSAADPEGKAGVAALTAALLTEGTNMKSAPQIATEIESLGAELGAAASTDFTQLSVNSPSDVFEKSATLLSELVHNAALPETELQRVKAQTLDSLRIALDDPGSVAEMAVGRVVFGAAPYGAAGGGTIASVPTITRDDVVAFYRTRWTPSAATLVLSGDIEPGAAFTLADKLFGDLRDAQDAAVAVQHPAGEPLPARVVVIDQPGAGQAAVTAASRSIARNDPDYYPLLLSNAVLGGGYSARLNTEIRIKRGLSYGANSSLGARVDTGLFTATAQTRNDAAAQVSELMATELSRLSMELVSDAELAPRRASVLGSFSRSLETVDRLGSLVAGYAQYGLPIDELSQYATKVRAVTAEQMRDATQRRLPTSAVSYVIVGDAAQFVAALSARYPQLERIPLAELNLDKPALR
jgi:zinc protease